MMQPFVNSMLDLGRMYVDLESQRDELLGKLTDNSFFLHTLVT